MGEAYKYNFTCLKSNFRKSLKKKLLQLWARKRVCSRCKCSGGRRRRRRWRIASADKASSKSTAARSTSSSPRPCGRSWRSRCCSLAKIASLLSTSASGLTEEGTSPKSMPSVKLFPSPWSHTIKSTSTKLLRRKSRTSSFLTTAPFSSRIPGGTSRKSSEDPEPEPVTRNLIVNSFYELKTRPDAFLCSFIYVSTQSSSSLVVVPIPSVRRSCFLEALFLS